MSSPRRLLLLALALALAACVTPPTPAPPGPLVTNIAVVARGWHTDICLHTSDGDGWTRLLAEGFDGASTLCFGFGERQYVVARNHSLFTMLSAMLPSDGAILMTALRDTPQAAFGARHVVILGINAIGRAGLLAFLRHSTQDGGAGRPMRLAWGPYPGSAYFTATNTYDGLFTCNTWTADGLRAAGLAVDGSDLFAGEVMHQARSLAQTLPGA